MNILRRVPESIGPPAAIKAHPSTRAHCSGIGAKLNNPRVIRVSLLELPESASRISTAKISEKTRVDASRQLDGSAVVSHCLCILAKALQAVASLIERI